MATVTWSVLADFNRDGVYETDLTPYVSAPGNGLGLNRGINREGRPMISTLNLAVLNSDGRFTPENSAGPYYGQLVPNVPIQVTSTHNTVSYTHWTGYIRKFRVGWASGTVPMCQMTCTDIAEDLAKSGPINVDTATTVAVNTALTSIATAIGLTAGDLSLDASIQTLPLHVVSGQDALTAMVEAAQSEMGGLLWVTADGKIRFENRHSRLGVTPDHTWGDGTVIFPKAISYDLNNTDLIGKIVVMPTIYMAQETDTEIFRFSRGKKTGDSLALLAGETYTALWEYDAPVSSITTPVAQTDYQANDAADGSGTDRTSSLTVTVTDLGAAATISLKNTYSATIYVTLFKIRGGASAWSGQTPRFVAEKNGWESHASSGAEIKVPFADDTQATRDYAVALERTYRYPYPVLTLTFDGAHPTAASDTTKKASLLALELGDLVLYKDTGLGVDFATNQKAGAYVNDWWYVEAIKMTVPPTFAGKSFGLEVTLSPSYNYRNLDAIAYDNFTRANSVGDLGTADSKDVWANDGNMDIATNAARANSDTLQMPTVDIGPGRANLCTNGGFETNTTGWITSGPGYWLTGTPTLSRITTDFKFGTACARIVVASGQYNGLSYAVTLSATTAYIVSFWYKGTSNGAACFFGEADGGTSAGAALNQDTGGEWLRFSQTFTTSADTANVFGIRTTAVGGTMDYVIDGVQIETGSVATRYIHTDGAIGYNIDQVVEASLAAIGAGDEVGLVLRYVDANNQYRVYLDKGSNEVILEKNVAGVVTELSSPAFTVGTAHELRALAQGSRIRVWADYTQVIDATDTALQTGTKVGLFARNANATATLDDFYGAGL